MGIVFLFLYKKRSRFRVVVEFIGLGLVELGMVMRFMFILFFIKGFW